MKKIILSLLMLFICGASVHAMKYEEALQSSKPFAILVYADWADDVQYYLQTFNLMATKYSNKYNFVPINICTKEAKAYIQNNTITAGIPYVIVTKSTGKISRRLRSDCARSEACIIEKLELLNY